MLSLVLQKDSIGTARALLLILPALDFVGDLMFVQLTELSGLDLMSDSHKLLLESILAGCVQHLHLDWCRIRTPSNTQTS